MSSEPRAGGIASSGSATQSAPGSLAAGGAAPEAVAAAFLDALLSAGWRPGAWPTAEALAATPAFDWSALIALADVEGVSPLLTDRLADRSWVPADVMTVFQAKLYATAAHNALLFDTLSQLLSELAEVAIRPIILKGPALVGEVYPAIGLRPMGDLDLLVREDEAPAAIRALEGLGFQVISSEPQAGSQLAFESEVTLERISGRVPVVVEIHWALIDSPFYRSHLRHDWFRSTAVRRTLIGHRSEMLTLAPEANVLYLAAHLVLHHTAGGQPHRLWLYDLAELIHRHESGAQGRPLDWDLVVRQTQACRLVLVMRDALARLAAWQVPIPSAALEAMDRLTPGRMETQVYRELTGPGDRSGRRFLVDLATLPGWRDRLRFAWQNILPSPAYMRERYDLGPMDALAPAYLRRWLRGLGRLR